MTPDPRQVEADRIAAGEPVKRFDGEIQRWCERQVAACFAALSLEPSALEYTVDPVSAVERAVAALRIEYQDHQWRHLRGFAEWTLARRRTHAKRLPGCEQLAARALARVAGGDGAERAMVIRPAVGLVALHLATLDEAHSPVRPLVELVARGVFPIALPKRAMLLYLDGCAGDVPVAPPGGELAFLYALACDPDDQATRLVYGDYLEQRGELARAEAIRSGTELSTVAVNIGQLYGDASWLLPDHEHARRAAHARLDRR